MSIPAHRHKRCAACTSEWVMLMVKDLVIDFGLKADTRPEV